MEETKDLVTQMICSYIIDEFHDSDLADKARELIEKERMTFTTEQARLDFGTEKTHYSNIHGIVIRETANKNDLRLMGIIIHEIQHMFSNRISGNQDIATRQIEEGFADLFSELVINNYRENHKEEYKKAFPNRDYQYESRSDYFGENDFVRMVLETIRIKSEKDTQAIRSYIFGDKNDFIEICEENIGKEFIELLKLQRKGGTSTKYNYEVNGKLIELIVNLDINYSEESDTINASLFSKRNTILSDLKKVTRIKKKLEENNIKFDEIGLEELPMIKEFCEQESSDEIGKNAVAYLVYKPIYRNILNRNSIQDLFKVKDIYGYFPAQSVAWDLIKDRNVISKEDKVEFLQETNALSLKISNDTLINLLNENTIKKPIIQERLFEYLNKDWNKEDLDSRKILLEKLKEYNEFVGDVETDEGREYKEAVQKFVKRYNTAIKELKESRFATDELKSMPNIKGIEEINIDIKLKGDDPLRLIFLQDNYQGVNIINKENIKNMTLAFLEEIQSRGGNADNIMSQLFSRHKSYKGNEKYNKLMLESLQEIYAEKEMDNILGRENISEFIKLITEDRIRFDRDDIKNSKICLELKQKAEKTLEELHRQEELKEQKEDEYSNGNIEILEEQSDNVDKANEKVEILDETAGNVVQEVSATESTQTIEYKEPQKEEVPLEQESDTRVEEDANKEQLQPINCEKTTVFIWMQRFSSWYNAVDKVPQKTKAKFVKMKADIVKVISKKSRNKSKTKQIQENEK